jgi:hypothetical protein
LSRNIQNDDQAHHRQTNQSTHIIIFHRRTLPINVVRNQSFRSGLNFIAIMNPVNPPFLSSGTPNMVSTDPPTMVIQAKRRAFAPAPASLSPQMSNGTLQGSRRRLIRSAITGS